MGIDDQELMTLIEERIEDERRATRLLRDSMGKTDNMITRLMLDQLALDSIKHEKMLMVILQLLEFPSKEQFRSEGVEFHKVIKIHVEIEHKMLEDFEEIFDKTEDKRIRFILQDIISDERRHHAVMRRVYELVREKEKVRDERWWDFLFRYSRLRG